MEGEQLMRTVVAAWETSDLRPLLAALHEDVVWKTASRHPGSPFSFNGDYTGRAGIIDVLSHISRDYTFHRMRPIEIMERRDVVWGLFEVSLTCHAKGQGEISKTLDIDWVLHWRLREGKVIEHQAFFDTAYLMMRQGAQKGDEGDKVLLKTVFRRHELFPSKRRRGLPLPHGPHAESIQG